MATDLEQFLITFAWYKADAFRDYCEGGLLEEAFKYEELKKILCDDAFKAYDILSDYPDIEISKDKLNKALSEWCLKYPHNIEVAQKFIGKGATLSEECKEELIRTGRYETLFKLIPKKDVNACVLEVGKDKYGCSGKFLANNIEWIIEDLGGSIQTCFNAMRPIDVVSMMTKFEELGLSLEGKDWTKYVIKHIAELDVSEFSRKHLISMHRAGVDLYKFYKKVIDFKSKDSTNSDNKSNESHICRAFIYLMKDDDFDDTWGLMLKNKKRVRFIAHSYCGDRALFWSLIDKLGALGKLKDFFSVVVQVYIKDGASFLFDDIEEIMRQCSWWGLKDIQNELHLIVDETINYKLRMIEEATKD